MKSAVKERVLELLKAFQGTHVPQSYIHKAIGASKSRVSEVLSELEREGLITRITVGKSKIIQVHPNISERKVARSKRSLKLVMVYSSEYLFLGYFVKRLARYGIYVEVSVVRSGLSATKAVAEGLADLALSPLVGQLYVYPAYKTYRIVPRGLYGGYRVLYKPESRTIYSSMISTMDYIRRYVVEKNLVDASSTEYFDDPSEIMSEARSGGYVVVWHPVYKLLEKEGFRPIIAPSDLDVDFCCTLAISNVVGGRTYELVKKTYVESITDYRRNPEKYIDYYSALTGIDTVVLKDAVKEYSLSSEKGRKVIERLAQSFTLGIPSKSIYVEAVNEKPDDF